MKVEETRGEKLSPDVGANEMREQTVLDLGALGIPDATLTELFGTGLVADTAAWMGMTAGRAFDLRR
eukprot:2123823-Prorocentrum_lima.AAC.1